MTRGEYSRPGAMVGDGRLQTYQYKSSEAGEPSGRQYSWKKKHLALRTEGSGETSLRISWVSVDILA